MLRPHELDAYHAFIKKYCLPETAKYSKRRVINNPETINSYWDTLVLDWLGVNQKAITEYLKKKDYKSWYLKTYWWYIIKHKRMLMDGFICTGNSCDVDFKFLEVHHKNKPNSFKGDYTHLGEEIDYMDCIQTLCPSCHDEKHNVVRKKRKKRKRVFNKRADLVILTPENGRVKVNAKEFNDNIKSIFSQETTITSDNQNYFVTITTKKMSNDELRATVLERIDTIFDALKVLNGQ